MIKEDDVLVIAELGMTHDGSLGQAKAMIKAAAECGVDAVKFQLHISDAETLRNAPEPPYFHDEPRYEYFKRTAFTHEQWLEIKEYTKDLGTKLIISPFSIEAADQIKLIGVDAIKIPSGEITNIPYHVHIASLGIPVIVSSGMSTLEELDECMKIYLDKGCEVVLMQCTSEYPCTPEHVGLNILDLFSERYPNIVLGFSDHTEGEWAAIAAFMKGARVFEKHFTLSRKMYGPDAKMSMEPDDMIQLCNSLRQLKIASMVDVDKNETSDLKEMKKIFQKSIVAKDNIKHGTVITEDMLAYKKPGIGLSPKYYTSLIGRRAIKDICIDELIKLEDVE